MQRLFLLVFVGCLLGTQSYAQLQVKNNDQEIVMEVTNDGKVNIADSLKVNALKNNTGTESSLVGVDQNGTLIKSDPAALEEFLVFRPVDNKYLIKHHSMASLASDTVNAALDVEAAAGIDIPDAATHVLIEPLIDINIAFPPEEGIYNPVIYLFMDDVMPADSWSNSSIGGTGSLEDLVMYIDGESHYKHYTSSNTADRWGTVEQQQASSTVVKLSATNTIAYKFRTRILSSFDPPATIDDVLDIYLLHLKLKGYYVPLSALLQQQ